MTKKRVIHMVVAIIVVALAIRLANLWAGESQVIQYLGFMIFIMTIMYYVVIKK